MASEDSEVRPVYVVDAVESDQGGSRVVENLSGKDTNKMQEDKTVRDEGQRQKTGEVHSGVESAPSCQRMHAG